MVADPIGNHIKFSWHNVTQSSAKKPTSYACDVKNRHRRLGKVAFIRVWHVVPLGPHKNNVDTFTATQIPSQWFLCYLEQWWKHPNPKPMVSLLFRTMIKAKRMPYSNKAGVRNKCGWALVVATLKTFLRIGNWWSDDSYLLQLSTDPTQPSAKEQCPKVVIEDM